MVGSCVPLRLSEFFGVDLEGKAGVGAPVLHCDTAV